MQLLENMKTLSNAGTLSGLIFGVIVILFVVISVLLIYSLLMISVETKNFETGVLRLVGMSNWNWISMILI
jgi:ABC-type antimicrobial peptide transport system permease subunit